MDAVSEGLRWIFRYLFYPAILVWVFAYLVILIGLIVIRADGDGRVRRLTAAVLPLVTLVFILIPVTEPSESLIEWLNHIAPLWRFLLGCVIGVVLLEVGRYLSGVDSELGAALYVLFLSLTATFLLYTLVEGALQSVHGALLGMVIAGGFDIIFRGSPEFLREQFTSGLRKKRY